MERKDLTNKTFIGVDGTEYVVLKGHENEEIVFAEKANLDAPLWFCCDAKIENSRLYSSYKVSYTVSKDEFYQVIKNEKTIDEITNSLKKKYYKIPITFLKLIGTMYLKEKAGNQYE